MNRHPEFISGTHKKRLTGTAEQAKKTYQYERLGISLLLSVFFLSGCSIFPTSEPKTQYTLSAPSPELKTDHVFESGLLIKTPSADASLNTAEIAVSPEQGTRTYIEGALWTDRAPSMLQNLLIQGFENSNLFPNVGGPGSGIMANLILQSQLRDFSVHYEKGLPVAQIDLFVKVLSLKKRQVLVSHHFTKSVPIRQNNQISIRDGFQKAVDQMVLEIIQWMVVQNLPQTTKAGQV
ncbi:ABC-type transport auxiliary lipoprotein family protein [Candidatus Bealeia paramacronuclearis]